MGPSGSEGGGRGEMETDRVKSVHMGTHQESPAAWGHLEANRRPSSLRHKSRSGRCCLRLDSREGAGGTPSLSTPVGKSSQEN